MKQLLTGHCSNIVRPIGRSGALSQNVVKKRMYLNVDIVVIRHEMSDPLEYHIWMLPSSLYVIPFTFKPVGGHPHMTSAKFWDFLTHSPPCPHLGLIYSTKFTQPPLLHLLLGYAPLPPQCGRHIWMPPYSVSPNNVMKLFFKRCQVPFLEYVA